MGECPIPAYLVYSWCRHTPGHVVSPDADAAVHLNAQQNGVKKADHIQQHRGRCALLDVQDGT